MVVDILSRSNFVSIISVSLQRVIFFFFFFRIVDTEDMEFRVDVI